MATRERAVDRGVRRGDALARRLLSEIRTARTVANASCLDVASALGWSQTAYRRFEQGHSQTTLRDLSAAASVLGLELGAGLHPVGDALLDKGHQALIRRFRALLSPAFRIAAEVPFPNPGDRRAWDLVLRRENQVVGVEAETRVRDIQWLVRRMHERVQAGGTHVVVLVLADTRANRAVLGQVKSALGPAWATSPRAILRALRDGQALPGSGVVLV